MTGAESVSAAAWPLVGRGEELAEIGSALGRQGVVIAAHAGIGKTRLAREAFALAERDGALAEWVQATRSAAAVPLGAFAALVPEEARVDDAVSLMRGSAEALRRRAGRRRIVLAIDDAQLLDPVSAALVLHLVSSEDVRVLATVRTGEPCPDAIVSLWKDTGVPRLELGTLGDAEARAMIESALGAPLEEGAARWVLERSQGNALYLHELVVGAVETGALGRSSGLWRLTGTPAVSATLRELVLERLAALPPASRVLLELLALGEPLRVDELTELSTAEALTELDAHGLVELGADDEVRLAHPLFGEALAGELATLRARSLRLKLVEALERRRPLTSADALRVVRLRLDASAEIPTELRLAAARAANLAGDPHLGAQLARGALGEGGGLPAALLLARAHSMRNRHAQAEAVLAQAEPHAALHAQAYEYVAQRAWNLHWGLHDPDAALALVDRAAAWSRDPEWTSRIEQARREVTIVVNGFTGEEETAVPATDDFNRRMLASSEVMVLLFGGRGDAAAEAARRLQPPVPLRDPADAVALGTRALAAIATGNDWVETEAFMGEVLRRAVRAGDHQAAGSAAVARGGLEFQRGRFHDAARWLAEAELHFAHHDTLGNIVHVHGYRVGMAYFTGDPDGALAALERMEAALGGHEPLPNQLPHVLRARGWAARVSGDAAAATQFREDAERLEDEAPVFAATLAYEALLAGASVAPLLTRLASRGKTRIVSAFAAHAVARAAGDGTALLGVAEELAAIGACHYGALAAAEAAEAFLREGLRDPAHRAAARMRELHAPDQGAPQPRIDGLDSTAIELTARERQLVELAAQGLTNAEIADRLVLSVRTIESHIYRAMQKLGVKNRRELR